MVSSRHAVIDVGTNSVKLLVADVVGRAVQPLWEGSEQTRLRVFESGHELLDWPEAEKQRYADEHRDGWAEFLDRLARIVAKRHSE